ncbi:hypothetical protein MOBT1_000530 [Malassezia obtusa]|uniref:Ribosomal protein/NADH dehydrogenase domain-containing protein n=1 Tax=Malassezia obtusa TaxID=76774 RepID=A0AAF0IQR9_9BASI|nr:hypothetical protein MOBT1_000530 [Malassezia obtusa]
MSSVLSKAFPSIVKEIRLHISPTNYKTIKQNNPNVPFLIREAQNTPARLFMRLGTLEPPAIEKKIAEWLS